MREPQRLCLEASWLLRPLLRRSEPDDRVAAIIDDYVRRFSSSADSLRTGAKLRIPREEAFDLLETVAKEAAAPHVVFESLAPRASETLLDYACTTAPTLRDALVTLTTTNRLQNDVPIDLEVGTRAIVRHSFGIEGARQAAEGMAGTLVHQLRAAVGDDWSPREIHFEHERPSDVALLEAHFRCPLVFGSPAFELHIAREDLTRPLRRGDPALNALLRDYATGELARLPHPHDSATRAVRIALKAAMPRGEATLEGIAAQLGVGTRTLQRRLDAEGTEFTALVDSTRRELVTELLSDNQRTLREVAWKAGFRDVSSLYRAVRRWTGQRPSQLRKPPG